MMVQQHIDVLLTGGDAVLLGLIDHLPGVLLAALQRKMHQILKADVAAVPGGGDLFIDALQHQIGNAHGVFVVEIQQLSGFHNAEVGLRDAVHLDGNGDPADSGFIFQFSFVQPVAAHMDAVAEGVGGVGESGIPVVLILQTVTGAGFLEIVGAVIAFLLEDIV